MGSAGTCANSELVAYPTVILDDDSRELDMKWSNDNSGNPGQGGAIFHAALGENNLDTSDTHFVYDFRVYFTDWTDITASEFDLNQVLEDGDTVIYGTQCYFTDGVRQFTTQYQESGGHWHSKWNSTRTSCSQWDKNTWHPLNS